MPTQVATKTLTKAASSNDTEAPSPTGPPNITSAWLEITGKCQLECVHCYADSGPQGTHGPMTKADWFRVIAELADLGAEMVQFIGGEPILHPDLANFIDQALNHGMGVEVYSNLVHVPDPLWSTLSRPGVCLATSYYSDDEERHNAITQRPSHTRTRANIAEAVRRGIPIRGNVVGMYENQRAPEATDELRRLGVEHVGLDVLRQVGRGVRDQLAGMEQLCGNCTNDVLAIRPDGTMNPCVFTRWESINLGNVQARGIRDALASDTAGQVRNDLDRFFATKLSKAQPCGPPKNPKCHPSCGPNRGPNCNPRKRPCGPKQKPK